MSAVKLPDWQPSDSFKAKNPQFWPGHKRETLPYSAPAKPMIRQRKPRKVNSWEAEFSESLKQHPHICIHEQFPLVLANGLRYIADFVVVTNREDNCHAVTAYEVKGQRRPLGLAKIKIAARLYPWISFYLATKQRGGQWTIEPVRP